MSNQYEFTEYNYKTNVYENACKKDNQTKVLSTLEVFVHIYKMYILRVHKKLRKIKF
jgi:hypothetical protein